MQIVRREMIGNWSARVVERRTGHYIIVKAEGSPDVVRFLSNNFDQAMRKVDMIVDNAAQGVS